MKTATIYLGIDVSKKTLDCALSVSAQSRAVSWRGENTAQGHAALLERLRELGVERASLHVVLEATGIYSQAVAEALHRAGIKTSVVNPRQVKDFARSLNLRAKNDPLDARVLARYGRERSPRASVPPSNSHKRLHAWVSELDAVVDERRRLRNRMESTLEPSVAASQKAALRGLERRLERIERAIASLIDNDAELARAARLLITIPGIAMRTAARVLSQIADKRFESARALAAYAGLTPCQRQSGTSLLKPAHISKLGNARLRRALYMPASVAARCCEPLSRWAASLASRGKAKMAIRTALMRKLLHIIFGVLQHNSPFDPLKASIPSPLP